MKSGWDLPSLNRRYGAAGESASTSASTANKGIKRAGDFLVLLLVGMSIALVWAVTMADPAHLNWSSWAYSEWLINYDGGFIRRGMGGWLLGLVDRGDTGNDLMALNVLVFANYAALCLLMVAVWWRSRASSAATLALAMLVPGGLFQMAVGNAFFFRKEIVFHVALGIDCLLYVQIAHATTDVGKRRLTSLLCALFVAQAVFMPLVHEAYAFLSFPAAWLIARKAAANCPEQPALAWSVKAAAVAQVAMLVLCAAHKGSPDVANHIWRLLPFADRLLISPLRPEVPAGGIDAIGWGTLSNLPGVMYMFAAGQFWIWGVAAAGIGAVLVLITLWNRRGPRLADEAMFRGHMAQLRFLFLVSLPMYVIGGDWGRWLSAIAISYLFVFFADAAASVTAPNPLNLVPSAIRRWLADAFDFDFATFDLTHLVVVSTARNRKALFLLALLFCLTFRAPECCMNVGSPFYRVRPMLGQFLK